MITLPIYNATISNEDCGILFISLVDRPAVDVNWVAFDKEIEPQNYMVGDDEQRMVYGVLLRANYPIFRDKPTPRYIVFDKETIKEISEKWLADGNQNNVDLNHNLEMVDGVKLVQTFIKDSEHGISPKGFEDVEDGSLFAQYKIENDEVWQAIKDGTFNGFSIYGWFKDVPMEENKNNEQENTSTFMKNVKRLLQKMIMQFAAVETDKGTIVWEGDDELKEGTIVTLENGEQPENGQYETEDGKIITIEDGKVTKIEDKEAEVAPEPEPEEMADPEPEPTPDPEPQPEPEPEYDAKAEIEALKAEIEALKAEMESLKAQFADFVEKPVVEPVVEEFNKVTEFNTGNAKLDKVCKRMQALRK